MSVTILPQRRYGALLSILLVTVIATGAHADSTPVYPSTSPAPAFQPPTFADNTFSYIYGANYRNPFIASAAQPRGADITRHIIEFKHVDAWQFGHNFANITLKRSNAVEPAAGGSSGAVDFYAILRGGVSINRVARRPVFAMGPLRDIDIQLGLDLQTKNTAMAPSTRAIYFGPNLQFQVASGFFNVALQLRKEWNQNGILGKNERYDLGFNIEPVWSIPLQIGRVNFAFDGCAFYNTAKGRDAAGRATRAEFMARPEVKVDVGTALGLPSRTLALGVGVSYWHNMFGKDAAKIPGANQSAPFVSLSVHLPTRRSVH